MTRITRLALALLATALALALTACGDDDDTTSAASDAVPASSGSSGASAAEADPAAFPATISHKFGTTRVETEPQRVVVVGYTEQDTVLALGVVPVGVREFLGGYDDEARPWAQEILGGKELDTIGGEEINYEAVAAKRPDLIIALNTGMGKGDYDRLTRIAPTIAQTDEFVDFGMPWQDQTILIGQALGREARAKELVAEVEERFARARRENPGFADAEAILAYGGPDGYGAYSTQDTRSRFLEDLGFKPSSEIDRIAGDAFFTELSQERFRLIDKDLVIMFGPQDEIEGHEVFGRLDAVKEDRIVYLDLADQFAGALGFSSVLSLPYLLDEELPTLVAAVDGDPATKVEQPE